MRRILVPLDGTTFSEAILPDARRLAGPDGELILIREAQVSAQHEGLFVDPAEIAIKETDTYLQHKAEGLRQQGVTVETESLVLASAASAIDESVHIFKADMIAIATHGRGPLGRVVRGGVAWRALAHSSVPVLLRHVDDDALFPESVKSKRRIMVPLDGSAYAERALPMAQELALEWDASLLLVQVVSDVPMMGSAYGPVMGPSYAYVPDVIAEDEEIMKQVRGYISELAQRTPGEVATRVERGPVVDTLVTCAEHEKVTDVVLASHGRTGLPRVILGSVADGLIQGLHMPIIVVPALVSVSVETEPAAGHEQV
jgi:nucleotide-binding universal stress UspA family protein